MQMSLPKVLYIAKADKGGGAEQRLNLTAQHYSNTLAFYVKFNYHTWDKVKSFPIVFWDRIFGFVNRWYYRFSKEKVNIKSRLFISEQFNQTWCHLKKLPEFWDCDIVHISNLHVNYFDLDALKEITKYKPVVLNVSDLWLLTGGEAYSPFDDGFKKGIATSNNIALYPLRNPWIDRRQKMMNKKHELFKSLKDRLFYMTNSEWTARQFTSSWIMSFGADYKTIVPGVNTNIFFNKNNRNWKKLRVLLYYTNSQFKNSENILHALNKITIPIDLYVFGNNIEIENPNITTIPIAKYIDKQSELAEVFNHADVFLYPSIVETFGMMAAEAKACGTCVIGTRFTAIEEQIKDKETGILVSHNNPIELSKAIEWCAENLAQTRAIGKNAAQDILTHYTLERYMKETVEYYKYIFEKQNKM